MLGHGHVLGYRHQRIFDVPFWEDHYRISAEESTEKVGMKAQGVMEGEKGEIHLQSLWSVWGGRLQVMLGSGDRGQTERVTV
jgi:hypothetical protein